MGRARWTALMPGAALLALAGLMAVPAAALEIVLKDVAPDRVERQRSFGRGELLPGTPDPEKLGERLAARGLVKGRPIYIRIFKAESELELWMQNASGTFTLLDVYPICHWTGTLGPKLKEGDKQSPEGFYSVGAPQTRLVGRWRKAFNLGFPNLHDQLLSRTGSYILVHGGCSSVGCYAMTDVVQNEIYGLAEAALSSGQKRFHVHIFPFRMTPEKMAAYGDHEWVHVWADLKPAYDSFEKTRVPPVVALCGPRYKIADGLPGETGGSEARLIGLKIPAGPDGQRIDPTHVLDAAGQWIAPHCRVDDEDQRIAAYSGHPSGVTATHEPSRADVGAVPPTLHTTAVAAAVAPIDAAPGEDASHETKAKKPVAPAKGGRRPANESGQSQFEPTDAAGRPEGFGSATFRGRERVTATGG